MDYERPRVDHDKPPFSRVFVVCSKSHEESDLRSAFEEYGHVEDIWVVKNKSTKENKGIAYVKFSKASEAALAMEKLHGKPIADDSKPIKALLADSKSSRDKSDPVTQLTLNEDKHRTRIFILVSKSLQAGELRSDFEKFGKVINVQILLDKETNESKGCAYVRFEKPSEAFNALENCDAEYKAVIAEPRVPKNKMTVNYDGKSTGPFSRITCPVPLGFPDMTEHGANTKLTVSCHTSITEAQLTRLFDICPGMLNLEMSRHGAAFVYYSTVASATYAKRRLHNLEYPPGCRIMVKYCTMGPGEQDNRQFYSLQSATAVDGYQGFSGSAQVAGYNQAYEGYDTNYSAYQQYSAPVSNCPYTDVALPGHQPLSTSNSCSGKLFFVCAPTPVSQDILSDVFCRFSDLIDIQVITGTAYGYIRYALRESADAAKMLLDGATIAGSTIRLSHSEQPQQGSADTSKRIKLDHLMR